MEDKYCYRVWAPDRITHEQELVGECDRELDGYNAAHHLAIQFSAERGRALVVICDARMTNKNRYVCQEGIYYNGRFIR